MIILAEILHIAVVIRRGVFGYSSYARGNIL